MPKSPGPRMHGTPGVGLTCLCLKPSLKFWFRLSLLNFINMPWLQLTLLTSSILSQFPLILFSSCFKFSKVYKLINTVLCNMEYLAINEVQAVLWSYRQWPQQEITRTCGLCRATILQRETWGTTDTQIVLWEAVTTIENYDYVMRF